MQQPPLSIQIVSTIGAMLCLIAYAGHQLQWIDAKSILYNLLNIIGSGILVYVAFRPFQAGFVLMETVWLLVSIIAFYKIAASYIKQ
jgi:hypothetical protein